MSASGRKGCIELAEVMTASFEGIYLLMRHVHNQRTQLDIQIEEVGPVISAVIRSQSLILPIYRVGEAA